MGLAVDRSEPDRRLGIRSLDSFTVPEAGPSLRYLREKEHRERAAGARRVAAVDQLSALAAGQPSRQGGRLCWFGRSSVILWMAAPLWSNSSAWSHGVQVGTKTWPWRALRVCNSSAHPRHRTHGGQLE